MQVVPGPQFLKTHPLLSHVTNPVPQHFISPTLGQAPTRPQGLLAPSSLFSASGRAKLEAASAKRPKRRAFILRLLDDDRKRLLKGMLQLARKRVVLVECLCGLIILQFFLKEGQRVYIQVFCVDISLLWIFLNGAV